MATYETKRRITKDEISQKCLLLEDEKGTPLHEGLKEPLALQAGEKTYPAELHDFYIGNKFRKGLLFPDKTEADGKSFALFFEQHLNQGSGVYLKVTEGKVTAEGAQIVEMTKP
jgi:hypothetical protein